jgi:hypothetical protein
MRGGRAEGLEVTKQQRIKDSTASTSAAGGTGGSVMANGCSSNVSSKTLSVLRSNSKRLELKVQELSQELADARREKLSLLRYKRQYEAAAGALKEQRKAAEQGVAAAEAAGLRAAAATGKAERLQMQVSRAGLGCKGCAVNMTHAIASDHHYVWILMYFLCTYCRSDLHLPLCPTRTVRKYAQYHLTVQGNGALWATAHAVTWSTHLGSHKKT